MPARLGGEGKAKSNSTTPNKGKSNFQMSIMLPTKVETDWPLCRLDFCCFNERGRLLCSSSTVCSSTLSQEPGSSLQVNDNGKEETTNG